MLFLKPHKLHTDKHKNEFSLLLYYSPSQNSVKYNYFKSIWSPLNGPAAPPAGLTWPRLCWIFSHCFCSNFLAILLHNFQLFVFYFTWNLYSFTKLWSGQFWTNIFKIWSYIFENFKNICINLYKWLRPSNSKGTRPLCIVPPPLKSPKSNIFGHGKLG